MPLNRAAWLAADPKAVNQGLVPFGAAALQVINQTPTAGDHQQQPAPGMVVLLVGLNMLRQLRNALTEEGNLHLWRATIGLVRPVLLDYLLFSLCRQCHPNYELLVFLLTLLSFHNSVP
jgi:hypothetical protein